jgi:hypothetical protein
MTLRFTDSFDHYAAATSADMLVKWNNASGAGNVVIQAATGRRGTQALKLNATATVTKTLDAQATCIIGFSFNAPTLPGADAAILIFLDAGVNQCDLRMRADGTLRATRNGTALGTSSSALSAGTTYYIEVKVLISDAAGTFEVRVNGSNTGWLALTSQDTKNTANATANQFSLSGPVTGTLFDDLYVCDSAGSTNNNFLGDIRVDAYVPSGNGNSSQLVGSDSNSVDNYLLVDEALYNTDTDYVQSATAAQKDTYAFTDMSHTPASIFGLQVNMIGKKDDSGNRSICSVIRSGGADTDGTSQALSTTYVDYMQVSETDPNTAAAWTKTNLNSAEFGVKVAA